MRSLALFHGTLLVAAALALSACQARKDVATLLAEASQYEQKGELRAAIIQYKNAAQLEPSNAQVRLRLGQAYVALGDAVSAEKELRRAVDAHVEAAREPLGQALLMQGKFQEVLDEFAESQASGARALPLTLRANAMLGLERSDEAKQMFERALALQDGYAPALLGLARLAVANKDAAEARLLVARALKANPGDPDSLRFKGDLARLDGRNEEALAAYREVLRVRPGYAPAHVDIANLLIDTGKLKEARAELDAARKGTVGTLGLFHAQAMLDFREKKFNAARESLQQILRAVPDHYPSVLLAAAVELELNSLQQAEMHALHYLDANPGHVYATKLLATVRLRNNQADQAVALLEPLLDEHGDDPQLLALAGEAAMRARRYDRAAELFEKASTLNPDAPSLHVAAGLVHLRGGDTERASLQLERAASMGGDTSRSRALLVMAYLRAKQTDKAMAVVEAMEKQANSPMVQNLKAGVFLARQDFKSARATFEGALKLDGAYLPVLDNLAQLDLLEKQPERAKARYLAALDKSPGNADLMEALARLATHQGRADDAAGWLEKAYGSKPDNLKLGLRLVDFYIRSGNKPRALTLAEKIQASNPSSPDALAMLAKAQSANGDHRGAADSYDKLATLAPGSVAPLLRQARAQLEAGDLEAALVTVREVIQARPDMLEAHRLHVGLLTQLKRYGEATRAARAAQKQFPGKAAGLRFEGDVLMAQARPADALPLYERAFSVQPSGAGMVLVHTALSVTGRQQDADARMAKWLRENPADVPGRLYLASQRLLANRHAEAAALLEQVLAVDPDNVVALNDLAWSLQAQKDARALGYAEKALRLAPDSPVVLDTLGWIHAGAGQPDKALPLLRRASALAPDSNSIRFHLGMVLARSGNKAAARTELQRVAADASDRTRAENARAALAAL